MHNNAVPSSEIEGQIDEAAHHLREQQLIAARLEKVYQGGILKRLLFSSVRELWRLESHRNAASASCKSDNDVR
jgi:hypothetical protein